MRHLIIGAHLEREDIEPLADALPVRNLFLSGFAITADQPLGDRELLLRVASIRARLLEKATFVAIRYGFAAWSPAEAESKCAAQLEQWRRLLEAHRDHVELTLKVVATQAAPRPDRHDFTSGADYLKALHRATNAASVDQPFRDEAERLLLPLAVEHRWIHRDQSSLELAMLIARDRVRDAYEAGEEVKKRCPHVPFLLSGPWPLEVFAEDQQ